MKPPPKHPTKTTSLAIHKFFTGDGNLNNGIMDFIKMLNDAKTVQTQGYSSLRSAINDGLYELRCIGTKIQNGCRAGARNQKSTSSSAP